MRREVGLGLLVLMAGLIIGCGQVPAFRVLKASNNEGYVELEVLTTATTSRDVRRVIDAVISAAREEEAPYHVTVYVVDTEVYIGVVYDVAVAYWEAASPRKSTVYLREKVVHPGSVPRPTDEELAYYGIVHRVWFNRPDLLLPDEEAFYDHYRASHSERELEELTLRVQRWLFQ